MKPQTVKKTLILLLFFNFSVSAQTGAPGQRYLQQQMEQHRFEEPVWIEATKELDYSPPGKLRDRKDRERSSRSQGQKDLTERENTPPIHVDRPLLTIIMKFITILIAAVALALLLKHFLGFGGIPWNKKIKPQELSEVKLKTIEENLHEAELDQYIRQAIEQEKYAMAIRLYFLAILKELSLLRVIRWKKNKTNREYLQELQNEPDYAGFQHTARIFERVWYGNRAINAMEFQDAEAPFVRFLQRLQERNRKEA